MRIYSYAMSGRKQYSAYFFDVIKYPLDPKGFSFLHKTDP